ncbi:hypothetical protein K502DRAFT_118465 [Neoconidiobolus thromboides FSU 785]|nr:hypothetical protein K502DRAFT_118465 [Neoconidiobolus thromboides FSU 785]
MKLNLLISVLSSMIIMGTIECRAVDNEMMVKRDGMLSNLLRGLGHKLHVREMLNKLHLLKRDNDGDDEDKSDEDKKEDKKEDKDEDKKEDKKVEVKKDENKSKNGAKLFKGSSSETTLAGSSALLPIALAAIYNVRY